MQLLADATASTRRSRLASAAVAHTTRAALDFLTASQLRVIVKRILRKYGYPPDKQEKATKTVIEQAEVLLEMWAAA